MAKKQSQKKRPQKQKIEWRRVFVAGLAVVMALLLLLPMISVIAGGVGAVTQSEIDALKEEQRESQVKQQELKNQLADVKEDQAAAQQRRQLLQQQLEAINAELDSINAQISYYDQEIAQKEAERREAEAKEQAQYELFCERVRAMEEEGTVSYWSILFNAENFSDMLDRLADIDAVMDYDNQVMEELTAARQELERLQAELESARAEEQAAKDQQEAKKAEQQAKVAEAQKLLDQINADAAELNRQLDDEMEGAAEIQAEIARKQKQLEEERRQNNVTIDSETNYLWPLPGYYRLTSLFGYRIHPITGKAHSHTGIDIPAPGGTPIQACKSGQVVDLRLPLLLRQLRGHRPRQRQLHPLRPHELPGGERGADGVPGPDHRLCGHHRQLHGQPPAPGGAGQLHPCGPGEQVPQPEPDPPLVTSG